MDGDMMGMLRQVMENPQFGAMVQAMKEQMGDGNGEVDPAKMMEKLPEMMQMLGPLMGGTAQGEGEKTEKAAEQRAEPEPKEEQQKVRQEGGDTGSEKGQAGQFGSLGTMFFKPGSREKRNKLLSALKPYLSPARCALVDRAMSAMQLGEILGTMTPSGKQ